VQVCEKTAVGGFRPSRGDFILCKGEKGRGLQPLYVGGKTGEEGGTGKGLQRSEGGY